MLKIEVKLYKYDPGQFNYLQDRNIFGRFVGFVDDILYECTDGFKETSLYTLVLRFVTIKIHNLS